jgi:4-hydroxy-3-polyprenylbenzoate decarboxylase
MRAYRDLREFLGFLEERGQLLRVTAPVTWDLEVTEIADRLAKQGDGPALYFENVAGSDMPVVINLFGSHQRAAWALGVDRLDDLVSRVRKLLHMVDSPPRSWAERARALGDVAKLATSQPKLIRSAPCQEVVLTGDDVDLLRMPVLKCWPGDAGRFITFPLVITRDPESGSRNVGIYRMQVYDRRTTGMHWQTHKVGSRHYRSRQEKGVERMDVAVALGADPATMWTGAVPLPPGMDEFGVSGFIRGQGVELVKCKTVDLEVPAHAEIVLEGYVRPDEQRVEGPFGDHTGYYSAPESYPVFHVTAMTMRARPIYPTIVVGRPPSEDFFMGKATERVMLPALQMVLPEVADLNMPAEGAFHNIMLVSIKKEYPGHAQKVMHAIWGMGLLQLTKAIVVVDHTVDIQDMSTVAWRVSANIDPRRDITIVDGPVDDLDHASPTWRFGSKVGIDATHKLPGEGMQARGWPQEIAMTPEVRALVDRRWKEYGL